jgi:hypothetical protein
MTHLTAVGIRGALELVGTVSGDTEWRAIKLVGLLDGGSGSVSIVDHALDVEP